MPEKVTAATFLVRSGLRNVPARFPPSTARAVTAQRASVAPQKIVTGSW